MGRCSIPEVTLTSSKEKMPVLALGTATWPLDSKALRLGLINSREELFISSKLWCSDAYAVRVIPALKTILKNLGLEYLDLYLVHWPVSAKPGKMMYPIKTEDLVPLDIKSVWGAMEECQTIGLSKSIGVSNFSCKKIGNLLSFARIVPAVNQVELNPLWQQKKVVEYCKENGIVVTTFSPLGSYGTRWGNKEIMESEVVKEIAKAKGKSVGQVCLRWGIEQGIGVVMKSFNRERLEQNMDIFDWELSEEDLKNIAKLPQKRTHSGQELVHQNGPIKSLDQLWDQDGEF